MANDETSAVSMAVNKPTFRARDYQYEMFDRSMKRNVIVAVITSLPLLAYLDP
jgi:ERCC4-related helicase